MAQTSKGILKSMIQKDKTNKKKDEAKKGKRKEREEEDPTLARMQKQPKMILGEEITK